MIKDLNEIYNDVPSPEEFDVPLGGGDPPKQKKVSKANPTPKEIGLPSFRTDIAGQGTVVQKSEDLGMMPNGAYLDPNLNTELGEAQGVMNKWGRWLAAVGEKTVGGLVETGGDIGTLMQFGDDRDYENSLVRLGRSIQDDASERFPIYRTTDGVWPIENGLSGISDLGWWLNNTESLVSSGLNFALAGFGIAKTVGFAGKALRLGRLADGAAELFVEGKGLNTERLLAQKILSNQIQNRSHQLVTSMGLAYTEGAQMGNGVFVDVYNKLYTKYITEDNLAPSEAHERARHKAAQSAATTVQLNTILGTATNMFELAPFFAAGDETVENLARRVLGQAKGETNPSWLKRLGTETAEKYSSVLKNGQGFKYQAGTALSEAIEEYNNSVAESAGREEGLKGKTYGFVQQLGLYDKYLRYMANEQGALDAFLGALGGPSQNMVAGSIPMHKRLTGYKQNEAGQYLDKSGNVLSTENNEDKVPVYKWFNSRQLNKFGNTNYFNNLKDAFTEDANYYATQYEKMEQAAVKGDKVKVNDIKNELFNIQQRRAVQYGFSANLGETYEEIKNIDNTDTTYLSNLIASMEQKGVEETKISPYRELLKKNPNQTEAMVKGYSESLNDNKYVEKATRAKKNLAKLQDIYDKVQKVFGEDNETITIEDGDKDVKKNVVHAHVADLIANRHINLYLMQDQQEEYKKELQELEEKIRISNSAGIAPDIETINSFIKTHNTLMNRQAKLRAEFEILSKQPESEAALDILGDYGEIGINKDDAPKAIKERIKKHHQIFQGLDERLNQNYDSIVNSKAYQDWANSEEVLKSNYDDKVKLQKFIDDNYKIFGNDKHKQQLEARIEELNDHIKSHTENLNKILTAPTMSELMSNTQNWMQNLAKERDKLVEDQVNTAKQIVAEQKFKDVKELNNLKKLQEKYIKELEGITKELKKIKEELRELLEKITNGDTSEEVNKKYAVLKHKFDQLTKRQNVLLSLYEEAQTALVEKQINQKPDKPFIPDEEYVPGESVENEEEEQPQTPTPETEIPFVNANAVREEIKNEELSNVKPVFHHTTVKAEDFNFSSFKRGNNSISQFGDGLNVSSDTTPFLVSRYGNPIEGEINDKDFVEIDSNKTEKELYDYLISLGYKFSKPASNYTSNEKANEQPAIIELFKDFQESNPNVKGVKINNHVINGTKVSTFYVIYDSASFYGKDSLKNQINTKYNNEGNTEQNNNKEDNLTSQKSKLAEAFIEEQGKPLTEELPIIPTADEEETEDEDDTIPPVINEPLPEDLENENAVKLMDEATKEYDKLVEKFERIDNARMKEAKEKGEEMPNSIAAAMMHYYNSLYNLETEDLPPVSEAVSNMVDNYQIDPKQAVEAVEAANKLFEAEREMQSNAFNFAFGLESAINSEIPTLPEDVDFDSSDMAMDNYTDDINGHEPPLNILENLPFVSKSKVLRDNPSLTFDGKKIESPSNSGAYLHVEYREVVDTEKGKIKKVDTKKKNVHPGIENPKQLLNGTPIVLQIDTEYNGPKTPNDLKRGGGGSRILDKETFDDYVDSNGMITGDAIDNVPIAIKDADGKTIMYVRTVRWLTETYGLGDTRNVPSAYVEEELKNLRAIRNAIVNAYNSGNKEGIQTTIIHKTVGQPRINSDGKGKAVWKKASTLVPANVELGIVVNNSVNTSKNTPTTKDIANKIPVWLQNRAVFILPGSNGQHIVSPLRTVPLGVTAFNTVKSALLAHINQDMKVIKAIKDNTSIDISTVKGIKQFINQYFTYTTAWGPRVNTEGKLILDIKQSDTLNNKIVIASRGKEGEKEVFANIVDGKFDNLFEDKLNEFLSSRLRNVAFTNKDKGIRGINDNSLDTFKEPRVDVNGVWKFYTHPNYNSYIKQYMETVIDGSNGVYTVQPNIYFDISAFEKEINAPLTPANTGIPSVQNPSSSSNLVDILNDEDYQMDINNSPILPESMEVTKENLKILSNLAQNNHNGNTVLGVYSFFMDRTNPLKYINPNQYNPFLKCS